jgi:acyl dehydratase
MTAMTERFFEDFAVGQKFGSGTVTVTTARIKAFAAEFDPQPFHLDEPLARESLFGGLVASGWHTAALTMRLIVDSEIHLAGGTVGAGAEAVSWPRPVRPGDVLHAESEVVALRPSRSRPEIGVMKLEVTTYNQDGEPVQIFTPVLMVRRRTRGGALEDAPAQAGG